ncbi:predicted protein [Streptomyces iranensis]|uniref:Uncharacterized protein n=1 Tax=Streptomyces iranensis TaxID=576784 RepID=A0A060ZT55_9ACTN|nr:predicted protein [Streptomyces iranensis]
MPGELVVQTTFPVPVP